MTDPRGDPGCTASWPRGPDTPLAVAGEVHLWLAHHRSWEALALEQCLSAEELARAARFRRPADRVRYVIRRGLLRHVLARYVRIPPAELAFAAAASGKPELAGCRGAAGIRFNASGSQDVSLYAVTCAAEVGVDVEYMDPAMPATRVAAGVLAPAEAALLETLGPEPRRKAFYALWTCKEACVKCTGEGLLVPLAELAVTLEPGAAASACRGSTHWSLVRLTPWADYAAAVAVLGGRPHLQCWWLAPSPSASRAALQRSL